MKGDSPVSYTHLDVYKRQPMTGEIIAEAGEVLTRERAREIEAKGVNEAVIDLEGTLIKVFSNDMVDAKGFLPFDLSLIHISREGDCRRRLFRLCSRQ